MKKPIQKCGTETLARESEAGVSDGRSSAYNTKTWGSSALEGNRTVSTYQKSPITVGLNSEIRKSQDFKQSR